MGVCAACNDPPDEVVSIYLAMENHREVYPKTYSGKLIKKEMSDSVQHRTLLVPAKKTSLLSDFRKATDGLTPAGYKMT
jgi:hypothetical protein